MRHVLIFDPESCTGCLSCMTNCSLAHAGHNAHASARLYIAFDPFRPRWPATFCRQCTKAPCAQACPVGAIQRAESKEYWSIDYARCIGCMKCIEACPFGALFFDPLQDQVIKCDTCEGDPTCVRSCPPHALQWRDAGDQRPAPKLMQSS